MRPKHCNTICLAASSVPDAKEKALYASAKATKMLKLPAADYADKNISAPQVAD